MNSIKPVTPFRKSSYSQQGGECIEVAGLADGGLAVRDSKDADGPALAFDAHSWQAFIAGVRAGDFPSDN
ncbi:DUF397 domain-containing protein [Kitasatospora sp. NPDC047058]|uniref:DUF397 domain-containing protein n=1 Tax=Kitasatospora sp. NPDC047058 TaxID=3155620 RepID=UPI003402D1AC